MKFESENQVKSEKAVQELTKDQNKLIDETNELVKELPVKQATFDALKIKKD